MGSSSPRSSVLRAIQTPRHNSTCSGVASRLATGLIAVARPALAASVRSSNGYVPGQERFHGEYFAHGPDARAGTRHKYAAGQPLRRSLARKPVARYRHQAPVQACLTRRPMPHLYRAATLAHIRLPSLVAPAPACALAATHESAQRNGGNLSFIYTFRKLIYVQKSTTFISTD